MAAVYFVFVHHERGTGSFRPQPQAPLVWSLYRVVLAHSLPFFLGGQPVHFEVLGLFTLEHALGKEGGGGAGFVVERGFPEVLFVVQSIRFAGDTVVAPGPHHVPPQLVTHCDCTEQCEVNDHPVQLLQLVGFPQL